MIALNLLIGPPLFRFALTRVGEARVTDANAVDGVLEEKSDIFASAHFSLQAG